MTWLHNLIYGTAYLGYVVGGVFVILGVASLVGLVARDADEFQPIGDATPPPPRRSPFKGSTPIDDARNGAATLPPEGRRA